MEKMWAGRTDGVTNKLADDFNSSIHFDARMYKQDITGSMVHALMLSCQGIITKDEYADILNGLSGILEDIESGKLLIDENAEDIHMFVEAELTKRIGDTGKKLHTARSRNDQVALDIRLFLRHECDDVLNQLTELIDRSQQIYSLAFPKAVYNESKHMWKFPSGARIYFGSMQHTKDRINYQGKHYDFVGFDELTHFTRTKITSIARLSMTIN